MKEKTAKLDTALQKIAELQDHVIALEAKQYNFQVEECKEMLRGFQEAELAFTENQPENQQQANPTSAAGTEGSSQQFPAIQFHLPQATGL